MQICLHGLYTTSQNLAADAWAILEKCSIQWAALILINNKYASITLQKWVAQWSGCRTCDREIASSTPDCSIAGSLGQGSTQPSYLWGR